MSLVVNDFSLYYLTGGGVLKVLKLSPHYSISNTNSKCFGQVEVASSEKLESCEHHYRVEYFGITLEVHVSFPVNVNISHKHVSSRDSHMLEDTVTVVLLVEAKLRTNISDLNARQGTMSFHVSNLDHKSLDAHLLSIDDQLSIDNTVGTSET
jgi:hypothetical protein